MGWRRRRSGRRMTRRSVRKKRKNWRKWASGRSEDEYEEKRRGSPGDLEELSRKALAAMEAKRA
jgi:hypothetical protein